MSDTERTVKPRIDCPVCGKNVAARKDGTVTHHCPAGGRETLWCAGGYRPAVPPAGESAGPGPQSGRIGR